jgi:catechol 2,3-dioxygenase-like lactoylglutathione lyase family enzyme
MKPGHTLRIARPTDRLEDVATMYADGLGLSVLGSFVDHDGFDGVILGHRGQPYHLEFTHQRGHSVSLAPSKEHLLVFYVPDAEDWAASCTRMTAAGFRAVKSSNPFWDSAGATFEDLDGYRVVLFNAPWADEGP